jgi:hypothetical protein
VSEGGRRPPAALLATFILAACTFVACGGDDDDSDGSGLSEADVQNAMEACSKRLPDRGGDR